MKNENKERILKYLSEMLDEEETKKFESELNENTELKAEFEKIKNELDEFVSVEDVDSEYFVNLNVKVRERLERKKRKRFASLSAATALTAAVLLIFFFSSGKKNNTESIVNKQSESFVYSDIDENFDYDISYEDIASEFTLDDYIQSLSKSVSPEEIEEYVNSEFADLPADLILDNFQINDSDFDYIYEKLKREKFL